MFDFMLDSEMLWIIVPLCMLMIVIPLIHTISETTRLNRLKRYQDIEIGMTEGEMLNIMGKGYNKSLLKNNRVKYEWRINASSSGSSYKGFSTRRYSGVKKVDIYIKDKVVEEVRPYNV